MPYEDVAFTNTIGQPGDTLTIQGLSEAIEKLAPPYSIKGDPVHHLKIAPYCNFCMGHHEENKPCPITQAVAPNYKTTWLTCASCGAETKVDVPQLNPTSAYPANPAPGTAKITSWYDTATPLPTPLPISSSPATITGDQADRIIELMEMILEREQPLNDEG